MKRKLSMVLTVVMLLSVFSFGSFAEEDVSYPNVSYDEKVTLNDAGEEMPIRRIVLNLKDEGDEEPYTITRVRLRDMAIALRDTEAKFDISFDGPNKAIVITTGVAYEPIELDERVTVLDDSTIMESPHKVLVDGEEVNLGAYAVNGETYSSVSSLNRALGKKMYIRNVYETGDTLISFEENDIEQFTKEDFDAKVKEKEITLVFAGAPWCPWTIFNLEGLIPFQQYIDENQLDAQIVSLVHDDQNYYKADLLRDYQKTSPNPEEELTDYPFYTVGMADGAWDHISEIAGKELKYLPSIFFMDNEGNLVEYLQGGDDEEEEVEETEEAEEAEDEEPVPYNYIEIYNEFMKTREE